MFVLLKAQEWDINYVQVQCITLSNHQENNNFHKAFLQKNLTSESRIKTHCHRGLLLFTSINIRVFYTDYKCAQWTLTNLRLHTPHPYNLYTLNTFRSTSIKQGAIFVSTQPTLGDKSYFGFNTASGDGTISPDGHPHFVVGFSELGLQTRTSSGGGVVDGIPKTTFEKMLAEQVV